MEVNDELGALATLLNASFGYLKSDARMIVVSLHSGEDRVVKNQFREWKQSKDGLLITKKPITPSSEEIAHNPRSRSAKMRIIQKL
jgi:16S rRNA (cytosine1402-N4)-methyltransferase